MVCRIDGTRDNTDDTPHTLCWTVVEEPHLLSHPASSAFVDLLRRNKSVMMSLV
jgi:hypothetical protein